jgi:hypothetical protein
MKQQTEMYKKGALVGNNNPFIFKSLALSFTNQKKTMTLDPINNKNVPK